MSEKEFYTINLKGLKQAARVYGSGEIKIGDKTGYYILCELKNVTPSIYQGVIIMRVNDRAIAIYATHDDKKQFVHIWENIVENSSFETPEGSKK